MNVEHTPLMSTRSLSIVGAILAVALLAWAGTPRSAGPKAADAGPARPEQPSGLSREIAREADGLWDRLRAAPVPRQPGRNPFTFASLSVARPSAPPPAAAPSRVDAPLPDVPAVEPPPPFKLVGIAEHGSGEAMVRTGIVAGLGKLFMVKAGDQVTARFTVAAVGPDVIELTDNVGGPPLRLVLK